MIIQPELSAIDMVQEFIEETGWNFARVHEHVLTFDYDGAWGEYTFTVAERNRESECLIQCALPFVLSPPVEKKKGKKKQKKDPRIIESSASQKKVIRELLALFNMFHQDASLGQFSYEKKGELAVTVLWVHRLQMSASPDELVLQRVLEEALDEIDELYASVSLVLSGVADAAFAYEKAIPEHHGTA
jgi:hypothetical protein